ncbi:MAG: hypothetical protein ACFB10_00450 [Salibacteraceae bacterium]
MTYFNSEYLQVSGDDTIGCSVVEWKRFATSEEFRNGMNQTMGLMKEKGYTKILSNSSNLGPIAPEDQKWVIEEWLPQALALGYNKIALIVPKDVFSQLAVDDIMEEANEVSPVDDKYFDNVDEAASWLAKS